MENTESTQRQCALRERATALGWPTERVQVIDCDQEQSGASAANREGFQRLVAEVSLGHAGILLGLEVSRLGRPGGTDSQVIAKVDCLLDDHTDSRIAALLNEKGWRSGKGGTFTKRMVSLIRCQYHLRTRFDRLRAAGMLTQRENAQRDGS